MSRALAVAVLCLAVAGCGDDDPEPGPPKPPVTPSGAGVWAVGDGGVAQPSDDRVGDFIAARGARRLLYLGDVYETGSAEEFRDHYHRAFGRFKAITRPVPGNHDWRDRAEGYDRYWARLLRSSGGRHYYSFDFRGWHFVALNTEEPIGPGSPQLAWLRRDLARRRGSCTIALSHGPRFNAGLHADDDELAGVWAALRGRSVALLSGHDHNYQRFRPVDGITQLVIGTGGRFRYAVDRSDKRLAASDDDNYGALRLRLGARTARFAFVTVDGRERDSGTLRCSRR